MHRYLLVALIGCAAIPAGAADLPQVDAPIQDVTVYSDRARITRRGTAAASGKTRRVRLPLLPPTLDPSSVRLLAHGATVKQVDVERANLGEFPTTEVEALLKKIEAVEDARSEVRDRATVLDGER